MAKLDVILAGVGGQGSLTASRILGEAATRAGLKVLVGEIHGMAQRGGIVESTVRMGEGIFGPIVSDGAADVLLGFEPVEAVRSLPKAGPQTLVITNTRPIVPFTVSLKGENYPEVSGLIARLRQAVPRVVDLDASAMAQEAGSAQALNTVLLGVMAGCEVLPFESGILQQVIEESVPERFVEVNRVAFAAGVAVGEKAR